MKHLERCRKVADEFIGEGVHYVGFDETSDVFKIYHHRDLTDDAVARITDVLSRNVIFFKEPKPKPI